MKVKELLEEIRKSEKIKDFPMPKVQPIRILINEKNIFKRLYKWLKSRRKWILLEDYYFKINDRITLLIKKGFIFDGASIPRIFWSLLNPMGLYFIPALFHDFAYCYKFIFLIYERKEKEIVLEKEDADLLLLYVSNLVVSLLTINEVVYLSVKTMGFIAWNKKRKGE